MDVILNGPSGKLEGRFHNAPPNAPAVLLLHPNTVHGGTMDSKSVYTLYRAFARKGFSCLRINFRGVGRSDGRYEGGEGEIADAAAALDWLQNRDETNNECWVGGVSFGAWISLQLLMRRPEISRFIAAALPVNQYDFTFFAPCPVQGLIIHGKKDERIPYEDIKKMQITLARYKAVRVDFHAVEEADHLFSQHLVDFKAAVEKYITQTSVKSAA